MGNRNTHKIDHNPDILRPLLEGASSPVETTKEGTVGAWEVALEEYSHPGGGRQTETREETEGTRSRRSKAGPRPHP